MEDFCPCDDPHCDMPKIPDGGIENLAAIALNAWNGVDGRFTWPADFPEGSRAAWRRVVVAIITQYAAANPGRSLTELPSLHQPDRLQGEDASQDKRGPRNPPAAPDSAGRYWQLVPLRATEEMIAAFEKNEGLFCGIGYEEMLAAVPPINSTPL